MSKAEEQALKAYPPQMEYSSMVAVSIGNKIDTNEPKRRLFIQGYEQAIEDAIEYLKANAEKYIVDCTPTYPDAPQELIIGGMLYEHLRQSLIGE